MKTYLLIFFLLSSCASIPNTEPSTWEEVRFGGIVEQSLDNSCGFASLLTIMQTHFGDKRYDEPSLLKKYMSDASEKDLVESMKNGLSVLELEKLAHSVGYTSVKKVMDITALQKIIAFVPTLVYLEVGEFKHFAVVKGASDTTVLLADPSRGNVEYSRAEFLEEWKKGIVLVVVKNEGEFPQKLLKSPSEGLPESLSELRRQMITK